MSLGHFIFARLLQESWELGIHQSVVRLVFGVKKREFDEEDYPPIRNLQPYDGQMIT